jgi:hypothetical protein
MNTIAELKMATVAMNGKNNKFQKPADATVPTKIIVACVVALANIHVMSLSKALMMYPLAHD